MKRKPKAYLVTLTSGATHVYIGTDLRLVRNRANYDHQGQVAGVRKISERARLRRMRTGSVEGKEGEG